MSSSSQDGQLPQLQHGGLIGDRLEEYRAFFRASDVLVRAPLCISLLGHRTQHSCGVRLTYRLPQNLWVGLRKTPGIRSSTHVLEYSTALRQFVPGAALAARIEPIIQQLEAQHGPIEVCMLAETLDGYGMAVTGAAAAALNAASELLSGTCTPSAVQSWSTGSLVALAHCDDILLFLQRAQASQQHLRASKKGGSGVLATLGADRLVFSDADQHIASLATFDAVDLTPTMWPIDLAVIGTGTVDDRGSVPSRPERVNHLRAFAEKVQRVLPGSTPRTVRNADDPLVEALADDLLMRALRAWFSCFTATASGAEARSLVAAIRERQTLLQRTTVLSPEIRSALRAITPDLTETAAIPLSSGSAGGAVLWIAPAGTERAVLEAAISTLRASLLPHVSLEYASWMDTGTRGGIELVRGCGVASELFPEARSTWVVYTAEGIRAEHRNDDPPLSSVDIALDVDAERLWIAGEPVSAKEHKSQRMAVRLLAALLTAPDRTISNLDLPHSTYRDLRGELVSKVVSPLRKMIHARTGKELAITTSGTSTSYRIGWDIGGLTIGIASPREAARTATR